MAGEKPAVKLGIVGCAGIARKVCRAALLAGPEFVELSAISSRSLSKAQDFAASNKFPSSAKAYGSYDELLDGPSVDAVYMPLPTGLHLEWVLKAAQKGKHILLEKPLSLSLDDLHKMFDACESQGLQVMDGTMMMHNARTPVMEKVLRDPQLIGDIKEVRTVLTFPADILFPTFLKDNIRVKPDLDALGALGDIGWYCVRASLWAYGFEMPKTVVALPGAEVNKDRVITGCSARLLWADGKVATFTCGFHSFMTMEMVVHGTTGSLVVDDFVVPFDDKVSSFKLLSNGHFMPLDLAWTVDKKTVDVENEVPQEASMIREFCKLVSDIKHAGSKPDHKWHDIAKKTQIVLLAVRDSIFNSFSPVEVLGY